MLKKIFKIFLIILVVGFISAFVRGYFYHSNNSNKKEKVFEDVKTSTSKQDMIDENTVTEILNKNDTDTKENKNNTTTSSSNSTNNKNEKKQNKNVAVSDNQNVNSNSSEVKEEIKEEPKRETSSATSTSQDQQTKSYIGIPNPNDFYYSFHHGNIEYQNIDDCYNDGIKVSFVDTVDIINTTCVDVVDSAGTILGEYLHINCKSGNCNRYKDILKK